MNLFVVGNGFDIAHKELAKKVTFLSFSKMLKAKHPNVYGQICAIFGLWNCENGPIFNWSDFENSLSNINWDVLNEITSINQDFETKFIKSFDKAFEEWVMSYSTIKVAKSRVYCPLSPNDFYLSFNYTETLEKTYNIPSDHVVHLHGSISDEYDICERSVRFFIGSKCDEDISISNYSINEAYKKDITNTLERYYDELSDLKKNSFANLIIIGFSLGEPDLGYFYWIKTNFSFERVYVVNKNFGKDALMGKIRKFFGDIVYFIDCDKEDEILRILNKI